MFKSSRIPGLLACGLLSWGLSVGTAEAQPQAPQPGGTLVALVTPEPGVLTTAINVGQPIATVSTKIFDGLIRLGSGFALEPELAQSWTLTDGGRTLRFNLRQGVRWHDGQPFNSQDVKFTIERVWRQVHPRLRTALANVQSVETPDANTVILRLSRPSPVVLLAFNRAEAQVLPKHLYEGTDVARNPANTRPVGTGPFRFKEWVRGERIVLERNPDYWDKGKPLLDGIVFRVIPDAASRAAAIERGEVQYANASPVGPVELERLAKLPNVAYTLKGYEHWGTSLLLETNLRRPALQDVRVRQAIAHAIDREALVKVVLRGLGKAAVSPVPSSLPQFFADDVPRYPPDIKAATRLLDEAGLRPDAAGVRLSLKLDWIPFSESTQRIAEFVRQSLRRVGISVEVRNQDLARFYQRIYTERDFDLSIIPMSAVGDPQLGVERLFWSQTIMTGVPFSNASGYASPVMDALIQSAHDEADVQRRAEYYRKLQRLVMTDLPAIPLVELQFSTVYSRAVRGLASGPDAGVESLKDAWIATSGQPKP